MLPLFVGGQSKCSPKMLSKGYNNDVLKLDEKVLEELKLKHPAPVEVKEDSLLHGPINKYQTVILKVH